MVATKKESEPNFLQIRFNIKKPFRELMLIENNNALFDNRQEILENESKYTFDIKLSKDNEDKNRIYYWLYINYPNINGEYGNFNPNGFYAHFTESDSEALYISLYAYYLKPKYILNLSVRKYPFRLAYYLPFICEFDYNDIYFKFGENEVLIERKENSNIGF